MSAKGKSAAASTPGEHGPDWLPGDPSPEQLVERIIRVDHAGEYGAVRIYQGQLAVLGRGPKGDLIREMLAQEKDHLEAFDKLVADRRVRPTALLPFWHAAGFALGAATALLGEKAAMACTVAVEETIDEHYAGQIAALEPMAEEGELKQTCVKFRDDELEHRDAGLEHGAREAPGYELLTGAIKAGSKLAIWLSTRI
ncbi:MAG: demethoxyubiquinone hydroxylase family protein [Rhodospirillaceae bacterium]